jgi:hypothetical protein
MSERKPPMVAELNAFADAIAEAERHRAILHNRFGLSDRQIGMMTLARRKPRNVMSDFAAATLAAKLKLEKRRAQQI